MSRSPSTVTVRVPGSTSNCGAGFDTLGLALSIHNRVTLTRGAGTAIVAERPEDGRAQAMVAETAAAFFRIAALAPSGFRYRIEGDVPAARGLGSSVTVIAGVLAGLDQLMGTKWTPHQLVAVATDLEGHPDNASAGILGGFCVSRCHPATGAYLGTVKIAVPSDLGFVVASPSTELLTKESRGALPATLPYFDAVKSINSAAYFTAALATGDYEQLRHAAGDFMHEPYRLPRIPGAREAIAAGVAAGAFTGFLSGSGSSVLCICRPAQGAAVAAAMRGAFGEVGVACETRLLAGDNSGLQVERVG
ncbi:MAG TPA: homoserine kinase [Opitutaceae bacterium]|nr:homoserine kinase [Opitutaceae bacterium]HND60109.1 homoserine kinase [Opitutaceae bacterium]